VLELSRIRAPCFRLSKKRACPILKKHVKELVVSKKTETFEQIKTNTRTFSAVVRPPPIVQPTKDNSATQETTELKQVVNDLIQLVKFLLDNSLSKPNIPDSLKKLLNA